MVWGRLEHSLGVGHLAYTLADSIYRMQRDELDISRSDVKCAEVAGACSNKDIFHTPMFPLTALHCKTGRREKQAS